MNSSSGRVFTLIQIIVGTFIGGPLAAGYFFVTNYLELRKGIHALAAIIITGAVFFGIYYYTYKSLGQDVSWAQYINVSLVIISIFFFLFTQDAGIKSHLAEGGGKRSWGSVISIAIVSLVIFVFTALPASLVYIFNNPTKTETYGNQRNTIIYNTSEFSKEDCDRLAHALEQHGYFSDTSHNTVVLEKKLRTVEVGISEETPPTLPDEVYYKRLAAEAQKAFPDNKVAIEVTHPDKTKKWFE